jgi:hypothetical protein
MSDLEVISFRPEAGQYAWTFGGAPPVMRIRTPAVLEVFVLDAYQLVTQAVESPLANVCDTNYTSVAKMPKRYLPGTAGPMGDGHARMREIAAAYRAG